MSQPALKKILYALILVVLVIVALYMAKTLLIPLAFGAFFAMVFHPLAKKLKEKGIPQWGGIASSVIILLLSMSIIGGVVFFQARSLVKDWPQIKEQLGKRQDEMKAYVIQNIGIVSEERIDRAQKIIRNQQEQFFSLLSGFAGSFFSFLSGLLLALVYMIFIMMSRNRISQFVLKLTPDNKQDIAKHAMHDARQAATQFMLGRMGVMIILAILYIIGFLLFGIQYAIPLALVVALLSIIPFLGNIIGTVFVLAVALATGAGGTTILGAVGTIALAQVLESYVLTPWVMSKEVSLSPLTTFTAIIGFGLMWGLAGTILAVPIVGALKKIFDHIDPLKPFGYVLGTD